VGLRATVSFTFDGAAVAGLLAKVGQAVYDGVETGATVIQESAKEKCPVDTGALQSSIAVDMQRGIHSMTGGAPLSSSAFAVSAVIAPHTDYSQFVEFGTGQRGANSPDAGPGPYRADWPGMTPRAFMRPAFEQEKDHAVDFIRTAVEDAIR
jgi:HK97 gp10 family phage protein